MIDLHMHSVYSDGTYTVEQIIAEAKALGLKQIAITDHNILKGSVIGSQISDIDFVVGIELSVDYKGSEVHLLGYFPNGSDYSNVNFIIKEKNAYKKMAIMEMIENLNDMGVDLDLLDLSKFAKGTINRVHICMALKEKGIIKSIQEGFENYVGEHCKAYVETKTISLAEACDAIHEDGGIAVIAHPYEYEDVGPIDDFLNEVVKLVDGIECYHPSATLENSLHLVDVATANNKIITGGSDFHGDNKPNITIDMMKVDEKYMIKRK
ncbi:MAG: PHP domain-containing protein [Firmicutes bacterium]|nr:PHP domain-containing protein [Candidatus Colivicinus equi]